MTIQELIDRYKRSKKVSEVYSILQSKTAKVQLKGLIGSSPAFIACALKSNLPHLNLLILENKEDAAYFLNDLESICGSDNVLFFPESYKKAYDPEETDNSNILLRAEVLNRINKNPDPLMVVSYPEALTEKVVTKSTLKQNTLEIKLGDKLGLDFVLDLLIEYGFERVDYVIEPGQFALRGGILDVFSFSNDNPFRVEFFGEDVDSLRTFDPVSQLSIANHAHITVIPNVQDKLLQESRTSFLSYIPEDSIVWIKNTKLALDIIDKKFSQVEEAYDKRKESLIRQLPPEELYVHSEAFQSKLNELKVVELSSAKFFESETITFDQAPQPSFNKNFDLLFQNLKENTQRKFKNVLFADTAKQVERIYAILKDLEGSKDANFSEEEVTPVLLSIHEGFIDNELQLACYTDHQIFERYHKFRLKSSFNKKREALTLKELYGLNPGDYVTHIDHGVGKFGGLEKIEVNGKLQEAIRLTYQDNDILYVSIHSLHRISKFSSQEGHVPKLNKLGTNAWQNLKNKTKTKVKTIAFDLIKLYAKRKAQKGFQFHPDSYLQNELEASFIYEDTPDQIKATQAVKKDMEAPYPMDRLVCGDVGFGKTEVAIRAAFKAVTDGKQVAILVPTTILALQHYKTFRERLKDFPCVVDYINRFKSQKEQKQTLSRLAEGKVDILIGTHRIVGKDIKFKDLGLLIIDEEQKFGVGVKDKLKVIKTTVDTLTLTATPIPRTLQFSLMGARDLSIIATPPPNRYPVQTEVHAFNEELIRDAVSYEVDRGGQVFFIHNRVQNIMDVAGMIKRLCPDVRVAIGHGQMDGDKLEEVMLDFIEGRFDVLVATTIIESGLDIPNANTIIINNAQMFGLSDLHQMRGRVGRSNKKALCYLLSPPFITLTGEARKRLKAIEEFADLGSGFNIAMKDLDIRGAGNLLGGEQSGFITEIGFETYMKILSEAIEELKENEFKDLFTEETDSLFKPRSTGEVMFAKDCQIDTDLEILIPDEYVSNITERLHLYKELDDLEREEDLVKYEKDLTDRFGPPPSQVKELVDTVRLRLLARKVGIEKMILKNRKIVCYFIQNQSSPFYQSETFTRIISYVQRNPHHVKLKEARDKFSMTIDSVDSIDRALAELRSITK